MYSVGKTKVLKLDQTLDELKSSYISHCVIIFNKNKPKHIKTAKHSLTALIGIK